MRLWYLLSIIVVLHNAIGATTRRTKRSAHGDTPPSILTPDFVDAVQQIVDAEKIPGLTLAVVHKSGSSELGAWGFRSEFGTKMTTDVCYIPMGSTGTDETTICLVDVVQYCFLFKGLPLCFSGNPDRRFFPWT